MKAIIQMAYRYVAAVVVLVSVSSANGAEPKVHLFILSGQSNMAGLPPFMLDV